MPISSLEGLIVTLLLLVPGGLGVEFRRWVYPARPPTPFTELLHALGASAVALIVLEAAAGIVGWGSAWTGGMGDALVRPLAESSGIPTDGATWVAYMAGFLPAALLLPVLGGRLRRVGWVRGLFGNIAFYDSGPDQLLGELWDPPEPGLSPWVVVETADGRSIQGQVVWQTTAPHPFELLLVDVYDITDIERPISGRGGILWIPRESIRRMWLVTTEGPG